MIDFRTISAVISDMDGVLWRGDTPLPGLTGLFELLCQRAIPFVLATNNSAKTRADYVHKLAQMGVGQIPETRIITSGTATVDYLRPLYPHGARVHVLGGEGLRQTLSNAGHHLVDESAEVVAVGVDFDLTYDKLRRATRLILNGALFIGTNPDVTYPMADGLSPGAGSIIAALSAATQTQPIIIGKPQRPMFESALRLLGTLPQNTLMIGDRLSTDIWGAQVVGLQTALVLTGITIREELVNAAPPPDDVFDDLPALVAAWSQAS